ncbi:MAG: peptidase M20 [Acidobacteria bacterium]|nr:MAG: peptidase M20 [Acidobacteriota bacterium]PYV71413.1 MAG: peptidase M20 [Acidobacteriota bacterium]
MNVREPADQLGYFQKRQKEIVETIRQLVELESPSDVKQSVDRVGTVLASRFSELGGKIKFHPAEKFGKHLQIDFRPRGNKIKPVLLLGHMDTVYPIGTISKMPCRVSKGRVWGPGVLDMKAGIALALHVIEAMLEWNNGKLTRPVTLLLVSDEEVGSASSRAITEKLAGDAAAVLVLEPAYGLHGAVKTARKGVGEYTLQVTGVAAHSGLDFEKGQNAVIELAHQVLEISKLVDPKSGVTLNVGKISGGTRVNVVPATAKATIDVRVASAKDGTEIDRKLRALKPFNPHCSVSISGKMNRPPLERTDAVAGLYLKARDLAQGLGWDLAEAAVGGGSDGNFTASLGIPTLDGLGAVGEGAHAEHESVVISELPRRAALLAGLIQMV